MKSLRDKVAVITGAGSGIGRSIALSLVDAGVHVVSADIQMEAAQATAEAARSRGVRSIAVTCDVSNPDSVIELADRAFGEFGVVDILCNNAGISWRPFRAVFDATLEDFQRVFAVNYWGVLHGLNAFLPRMRRQPGEKHIVNTASLSSMFPAEAHAAYSSSKAAVASLSEVVARELAPHGFGVTILCPGMVKTNLAENTVRLQAGDAQTSKRQFEHVDMRMLERVNALGFVSVDSVGVMVRNAILDNSLYLHTHVVPQDMVAERVNALFGPSTVGRV